MFYKQGIIRKSFTWAE